MKRFKIILVALVAATMIQAVPITANAKTNNDTSKSIVTQNTVSDKTIKIIDTIMSDQLALFKIFSNILLPSLLFIFSFLTLYHKKLFLYTFYYKFFKK